MTLDSEVGTLRVIAGTDDVVTLPVHPLKADASGGWWRRLIDTIKTLVPLSVPLPLCYLNGTYLPLADARISPLDRGFLFGDAVYEVVPVHGGRPFRLREHLDRLNRSLAAIRMAAPRSHPEWATICAQLTAQAGGEDS